MAWSIQWSVALVVFLLVMAGSGWFVYTYALGTRQQTSVPPVTGMPITEAAAVLGERGLGLGRQTQVASPTVPKYYIISQKPASGRVVRLGRDVDVVVSMGQDFLRAPDIRGKALEEARRLLGEARFRVGSLARIPSDIPRDTVLSQDPPPGGELSGDAEVHLLLSAGNTRANALMPDLRGVGVADVERLMAPFGVALVANPVDLPDAQYDIVLAQTPPPDSLIYPDQVVTYDYRPSGALDAPSQRHQTTVRHEMAYDWYGRDIRVDIVDRSGSRQTVWAKPPSFDDASRVTYLAGAAIRLPVSYVQEAVLEVYVDGTLEASYRLSQGNEPVRMGTAASL
ncbi:MAG TPA: PASTA domain-containing protein [Candidatus Hydrogenedentes bacterium]|nr:PASTA domain-containing protein [Candidatus Hydrogenedentota bacterium]